MNLVIFSGNLAKDAKLIVTSGGKQCCVTTLAIREDLRPETKPATFIDIIIWGERAEKLSQYLTKGKAVSVVGRLEINKTIGRNNITYITPRVVVSSLEFIGRKGPEVVEEEGAAIVEEVPPLEAEEGEASVSEVAVAEEEVPVSDSEENVPF
jgi:single-strand DNA-binding protein